MATLDVFPNLFSLFLLQGFSPTCNAQNIGQTGCPVRIWHLLLPVSSAYRHGTKHVAMSDFTWASKPMSTCTSTTLRPIETYIQPSNNVLCPFPDVETSFCGRDKQIRIYCSGGMQYKGGLDLSAITLHSAFHASRWNALTECYCTEVRGFPF